MALQVWLPLNGDGHNQGLLNLTPTTLGTVSWVNDGKIGKALSAGDGTQIVNGLSYNTNLLSELGTKFSCSIWVRPLGNHVHYNGTFISSGNWNAKAWTFGVSQDNSQVDVFSMGYNTWITCNVPVNTWTHLACTNDNGLVKLYKNGQYVGEITAAAGLDSDHDNFTVGRAYAGGYFSFNGNINDVRIYDHVLSPREIAELAKGLVLHYPLNHEGFGQNNLLINTADLTKWSKESGISVEWDDSVQMYKVTDSSHTSSRWGIYQDFTCEPSTTYTFSVTGKKSDNNVNMGVQSFESTVSWSANVASFSENPERKSYTITTGANHTKIRIYLNMNPTTTTSNTAYYLLPKLELGSVSTPWSPNSADAEYAAMGANGNVIYDTSGFGNNGTVSGVTYSSDSARYSVSTKFDGSDDYIEVTSSALYQIIQGGTVPFTIAFWIYHDDSTRAIAFGDYGLTGGIGFNIELSASHGLRFYWNGSPDWNTSVAVATSGWSHAAFVYDGTDLKCYKDGVLTATKSGTLSTKTKTSGAYRLGRDNRSGTTVLNGKMSDFRIYATALTADQVKQLYEAPISLANNGTLFANEFNET